MKDTVPRRHAPPSAAFPATSTRRAAAPVAALASAACTPARCASSALTRCHSRRSAKDRRRTTSSPPLISEARDAARTSLAECLCMEGTLLPLAKCERQLGDVEQCYLCHEGAFCVGGYARPVALPGGLQPDE